MLIDCYKCLLWKSNSTILDFYLVPFIDYTLTVPRSSIFYICWSFKYLSKQWNWLNNSLFCYLTSLEMSNVLSDLLILPFHYSYIPVSYIKCNFVRIIFLCNLQQFKDYYLFNVMIVVPVVVCVHETLLH